MTEKFDVKMQARSLSKMLDMAAVTITKPGGAIHTERLIDYVSEEFAKLTSEQTVSVLAEIDKGYEKNLLRDGHGEVIGYAHSKKIFVTFRMQEQNNGQFNAFAVAVKNGKEAKEKKSSREKAITGGEATERVPLAKSNAAAKTIVTTKHAVAAKPASTQKSSVSRRKSAAKVTSTPVKRARIKNSG